LISKQASFKLPSPLEKVQHPLFSSKNIEVFIKRDDLIHLVVSGNKWRKLKYNFEAFSSSGKSGIITLGGAYSNHLVASAEACWQRDIPLVAIVRGEEASNPSLDFCRSKGMKPHFISRDEYRHIRSNGLPANLIEIYGDLHFIPEGGSNVEGIRGCQEILSEVEEHFDLVFCPIGSGTTLSGLISGPKRAEIVGVSSLKGGFMEKEIEQMLSKYNLAQVNPWSVLNDFHFGGFAKVTQDLVDFTRNFKQAAGIQLDYIYTAKMVFGMFEMLRKGGIPQGSKLLLIHTGGLQGNASFESRFD